jgi:hypothetical protein
MERVYEKPAENAAGFVQKKAFQVADLFQKPAISAPLTPLSMLGCHDGRLDRQKRRPP